MKIRCLILKKICLPSSHKTKKMKKWVYVLLSAMLFCIDLSAQSTVIQNGDFDNASITVGTSFNTGFGSAYSSTNNVISDPKVFMGQNLGQGGDLLICTDDLSKFSKDHSDPSAFGSVARGKYLIAEPGKSTRNTSFSKKGASRYVKAELWSQTVNSLSIEEAYYFQLYGARLLPNGTNSAKRLTSEEYEMRVMAYWTVSGVQYSEEVLAVDINKELTYSPNSGNPVDHSNKFRRFSNDFYVARASTVTFSIELIYAIDQDGSPKSNVVLAIDDIAMDNYDGLLSLAKPVYCVNEYANITPVSGPSSVSSLKVFRNGITVFNNAADYSGFQNYQFTSSGAYRFEITLSTPVVLYYGKESVNTYSLSAECRVLEAPSKDDLNFAEIIVDDFADNEFSFFENLKNATNYQWNFGDGTGSNAATVNHEYSGGPSFNVSLTAFNEIPTCSLVANTSVSICDIANKPEIVFSTTKGAANSVTLDITSPNVNGDEYLWTLGDGTSLIKGDESDVQHTYTDDGEYQVCVSTKASNCYIEECDIVSFCHSYDIPQVLSNDCGNQLNFTINADDAVKVTWYTPSGEQLGTGHSLNRQIVSNYRTINEKEVDYLKVTIDNGCSIQEIEVPYESVSAPISQILAINLGNSLELYHTYDGTKTVDVDWDIEAYNNTTLVSTQSLSNDGAIYSLPPNVTSVKVTLTLTYSGTSCETEVIRYICIPSESHDCCDGCTAGN